MQKHQTFCRIFYAGFHDKNQSNVSNGTFSPRIICLEHLMPRMLHSFTSYVSNWIVAWRKWPTFCGRRLQMYFSENASYEMLSPTGPMMIYSLKTVYDTGPMSLASPSRYLCKLHWEAPQWKSPAHTKPVLSIWRYLHTRLHEIITSLIIPDIKIAKIELIFYFENVYGMLQNQKVMIHFWESTRAPKTPLYWIGLLVTLCRTKCHHIWLVCNVFMASQVMSRYSYSWNIPPYQIRWKTET